MSEPLLRPWTRADADDLMAAVRAAPDLSVQVGGVDLSTQGRAREFIGYALAQDDRSQSWAVDVDGAAVGNVAASAVEWRHRTAWLSYWLRPDVRGRGLARRALATLADRLFSAGLHRLELGHRVDNPPSCRVATAAGFVVEGLERDKLWYGGLAFDVETHARLSSDPRPALPLLDVRE